MQRWRGSNRGKRDGVVGLAACLWYFTCEAYRICSLNLCTLHSLSSAKHEPWVQYFDAIFTSVCPHVCNAVATKAAKTCSWDDDKHDYCTALKLCRKKISS